jgi:hypothetical protein
VKQTRIAERNKKMKDGGNNYGIDFCGLLTIVFIVLKLIGYISWSWIWVLSPLWISWLIAILLIIIFLIIKRIL